MSPVWRMCATASLAFSMCGIQPSHDHVLDINDIKTPLPMALTKLALGRTAPYAYENSVSFALYTTSDLRRTPLRGH